MKKLNSQQLRKLPEEILQSLAKEVKRNPLYFVVEDVLDTYNVGSIFRLADALAVKELILTGRCETPPNPKIKKASVGTYKVVPWKYYQSTASAFNYLRKKEPKIQIIALEQTKESLPYFKAEFNFPLALVVGNETEGIKVSTLKKCDLILEIPMFGLNKSLNVMVALAVVSYHILSKKLT